MTVIIAFLISVLAMFGDALASFFKRRLSLERGKGVPLLDQLDFLILPLPLVIILSKISYLSLILILVVTPPIHFLFNLLAYHLGLKEVPW